jgi:hypothetical protein
MAKPLRPLLDSLSAFTNLASCIHQVIVVRNVVSVEYAARFMSRDDHRNLLRDAVAAMLIVSHIHFKVHPNWRNMYVPRLNAGRIGSDEKQDAKMYPASSCSLIFLLRREECFHPWSASPKQSCDEKQAKHSQNEKNSDYEVIAAPIIMRHHYAALA